MGQRQQRSGGAELGETRRSAAMKRELRRAMATDDLNPRPEHTPRVSCAKRLHGGFFGRKAGGERRGEVLSASAVGDFASGEHTIDEAIAPSLDGIGDAMDLCCVDADADDVHKEQASGFRPKAQVGLSMPLPPVPASFYWTTESWGGALRCRPLDEFASHLFTTRQLQLAGESDDQRLAQAVGAERVVSLAQVHGASVVAVHRDEPIPGERAEADVLVTDNPTVGICVRAADCVPILMADRKTGAVAAVHAGWRGTAARAAVSALTAMEREFGTRPHDVVAAIGPSIGPCCYEVGSDLVDAFAAAGHERYLIDRWFSTPPPRRGSSERSPLRLNVAQANGDQLILAGVPPDQIHDVGLCTAMHLDVLTSYRAEKEKAGRIAGVIRSVR